MEQIFSYIERHTDEYIEELAHICRQPSISATGEGLFEMAEILKDKMIALGGDARLIPTKGSPIVYSRFQGRSNRTLMFYNHYDVQPAGSRDEWTSDPFGAEIRDGAIYARGSVDNKGNIICRMKAVEAYLKTRGFLPISVTFVIEGQEEMGSPHLGTLVSSYSDLLAADGIVWEGGFKDFSDRPEVYLGANGIIALELTATTASRELHSMYAAVAPGALWSMVRVLNSLQNLDGTVLVEGFYEDVVPPSPEDMLLIEKIPYAWEKFKDENGLTRMARDCSNSELMTQHIFHPSCNISGLVGGYSGEGYKSLIPNLATAKVDFKLVPNQNPGDILAKVERHIRTHSGDQIQIKVHGSIPPFRSPVDSQVARATISAAQDAYGQYPLVYPLIAGATPMVILAGQLNIPAIMAGCGSAYSNIHAADEHLRIDEDFIPGIKHMAALIERFAK